MGCLQFHDLGEALGARQARGQVEARIDIASGDVDDLAIERRELVEHDHSCHDEEQQRTRNIKAEGTVA